MVVPEPTAKALAYHRSGTVLWVLDNLWALVVPAVLLWTGFSARMRDWSRKIGRKWFFVIAVYWILFVILNTVVDLPRVYYEEFIRQHAYGLSNQTLGKWASDQAANFGVTLVLGALVLWVPYLMLKRSPQRWWLYTAILAVPFIVFVQLIQPIWIDPLFNTFGPMKDKALRPRSCSSPIALALRAGACTRWRRVWIPRRSMPTSMDSATPNASSCGTRSSRHSIDGS